MTKNEFDAGKGSFLIKLRPSLEWDKVALHQLVSADRRIPTGFRPPAQGCAAGATLGQRASATSNRNAVAAAIGNAPKSAAERHWDGGKQLVFLSALTCVLSPRRGFQPVAFSKYPAVLPFNPAADLSKDAGRVSPSPWGEGRDEGERKSNFPPPVVSLQPPAQFRGISRAVPDGQHFDFLMLRVDGEVNRVRPRSRHCGFVRQPACQPETFRLPGKGLKCFANGNVQSLADPGFALIIEHHGLIPVAFGVGPNYDREGHFLARRRSWISVKTCSTGFPRPGCFNASSARRSSSAFCSAVSSSLKSPNSKSMVSISSRRSGSGIRRNSSRISVLLMASIYSVEMPVQATFLACINTNVAIQGQSSTGNRQPAISP